MMSAVLGEGAAVYLGRREYVRLHLAYAAVSALVMVVFWPTRDLVHFLATGTAPAVFRVTMAFQAVAAPCMGVYIGLDRMAGNYVIRYSEWLERTSVPVAMLLRGKILTGLAHSVLIAGLGLPFAVVAAGPSGVPIAVVLVCQLVVLLAALCARLAGMIISRLGERSLFIRVTGSWVFLGLLYVATERLAPQLNPVVAIIALTGGGWGAPSVLEAPAALDGGLAYVVWLGALALLLAAAFSVSLVRIGRSGRRRQDA